MYIHAPPGLHCQGRVQLQLPKQELTVELKAGLQPPRSQRLHLPVVHVRGADVEGGDLTRPLLALTLCTGAWVVGDVGVAWGQPAGSGKGAEETNSTMGMFYRILMTECDFWCEMHAIVRVCG